MKKLFLKKQPGFSLIEMVVAIALFSVIMTAAGGIFQAIAVGQRNAIAATNIQETFRYGLEVMSKEVRNAQMDGGECNENPIDVPDGKIYAQNSFGDLIFKNKDNQCVRYYLSGGQLFIARDDEDLPITPSGITISNLKFLINDELTVQPSIILLMSGYVNGQAVQKEEIKIQTAISSRYYE